MDGCAGIFGLSASGPIITLPRMRTGWMAIWVFGWVLMGKQPASGQEAGEDKFSVLKKQFEELRADADRGILEFEARYEAELEKLQKKAQEESNLELVLAVRAEKENYRKKSEKSPHAPLAQLQAIYVREMARLEGERRKTLGGLVSGYHKGLVGLQAELTRAGKIDEALSVQAEVNAVAVELSALTLGPNAVKLSDLIPGANCKTETLEDGALLVVGTDGTRDLREKEMVTTPETYRPPFRITLVAKTDSTNLRMIYGVGRVILNWEVRLNELRFADFETGKGSGVGGKGAITPNEWHTIELEVHEKRMVLTVDGEERVSTVGNYSSQNAAFSVGPSQGSKVTVKSLVIEKL